MGDVPIGTRNPSGASRRFIVPCPACNAELEKDAFGQPPHLETCPLCSGFGQTSRKSAELYSRRAVLA